MTVTVDLVVVLQVILVWSAVGLIIDAPLAWFAWRYRTEGPVTWRPSFWMMYRAMLKYLPIRAVSWPYWIWEVFR